MEEKDPKNRAHMGKCTLTTYKTYGHTVLHSIPCTSLNTYLLNNGYRIHIIKGYRIHIIKGINLDHNNRHIEKRRERDPRLEIDPNPINPTNLNQDKKENKEANIE